MPGRFARFILVTVGFLLFFADSAVWRAIGSESAMVSATTALIVYDGLATAGDGLIAAREIANLMPHFGYGFDLQPMAGYSAGIAEKYEVVFFCGMSQASAIPAPLLNDLARRTRTVCWVDQFVGQLTALPGMAERLGFVHLSHEEETDYTTVTYRGIDLQKTDPDIDRIKILNPARVRVLASAGHGPNAAPFALRSGNFWLFAGPIFSFTYPGDQGLVFMDLLHEILKVQHFAERRALVRLEDVSAFSSPANLRRLADVLSGHNAPFQIGVIPIFKDPVNQIEVAIADRPEVAEALRYMTAHGGSVVMHGVTHQWKGVSGVDFEFWNSATNRATPDGVLGALRPKLQRGFEELFRAGLYPVTFETPHYAASLDHYRLFARFFSHCYERRMVCDDKFPQEYFPFPTTDICGQAIIPENLGYVHADDPQVQPIIDGAHAMTVVRDPLASFYFHAFLPPKALEKIVTAMQADGYRFISIKDFAPHVAFDDYAVSTARGQIRITPVQPFLKTVYVDARGKSSVSYCKVKPDAALSLAMEPPPGGLVAVRSVGDVPASKAVQDWRERLGEFVRGPVPASAPAIPARQALIVGKSPAFESFLGVYGIPFRKIGPSEKPPRDAVIVIPHDSIMDNRTLARLTNWIGKGGRAIIEGRSAIAENLGFQFTRRSVRAKQLQDVAEPDVPIECVNPFDVEFFKPPPNNLTLVQSASGDQPFAVAAHVGAGTVIYLAASLDPETAMGYVRYPFLMLHLRQQFGLEAPVTADGAEFYFDPGYREGAPLEEIVTGWKNEGVRAIYAAAWHFWPSFTYDYDTLIRLCHQNGIAVYAWIELPFVSPRFWEAHPEWREKTATGLDAQIGWRQFMNFCDDDCRAAAMKWMDNLLNMHDWDGVNIAELNFDTKDGLKDPAGYVPMNDACRAQFQKQAGFDPIRLFDAQSPYHWKKNAAALARWTKFRTNLTRDWLAEVLERVGRHKLDTIVTALDSFSVPRVVEKNGCDSRDAIALMERYPFTLQVEDSEEMWGESPNRYLQFGEVYRKLVRDPSRLMFDINIVKERLPGKAPTAQAAGVEFALTARAAATAGNGRVAIYSEASVLENDRALLPSILGSGARVSVDGGATTIESTRAVSYRFPYVEKRHRWWNLLQRNQVERRWPIPKVDGQPWFYGTNGRMLLGAGKHRFTYINASPGYETVWVKNITAPFTSLVGTKNGFAMDYDSPRRSWLTMSQCPSKVLCDGEVLPEDVVQPQGKDWLVRLPPGRHRAEIHEANDAAAAVREAGEEASDSIVWIAFRCLLLLLVLYAFVRLQRLWEWLRAIGKRNPCEETEMEGRRG